MRYKKHTSQWLLKRPKYAQIVYTIFALISVIIFAFWWFNILHVPHNFSGFAHIVDFLLFILVSLVIWHPITMEVLTWSISSHIKNIHQVKPVPGMKVAFVTTIVPANESISLLHKCLPAMVNVAYAHDTWLLDEADNEEVKEICKQYGVKHFSRRGIEKYNNPLGKYTKSKGGNHNSWYDAHGNDYDIVAQIDTDFVPKRSFLLKTLGYFRNEHVAFVGTPQIYGNTSGSLIAQGADEQQFTFYGSVLRGLSGMGMPLLIGANHLIRVAALKGADHYKAHITEDLPTGMKLHAQGWESIYLPYPLAIGEGPFTWEAYFSQQMRWAYGCIDLLFHFSPKLFKRMGLRRSIYYFFLQQHYFSGLAMAMSVFLLSLYFAFGLRAANIDLLTFLTFYSFVLLTCWLISVWLQRYNVYPKKEGELLLAGKIINIAAWPIWFIAFISVLIHKRLDYKVTPKGENEVVSKTSLRVFIPHFIFALIPTLGLISSLFTHRQNPLMLFWAFSAAFLMLTVPFSQEVTLALSKVKRIFSTLIQKLHTYHRVSGKEPLYQKSHSLRARLSRRRARILQSNLNFEVLSDYLFLIGIVLTSCVLYIRKIGFYSDDWSFLGNFSLSHNQSLVGLIKTATTANTLMRPMQNIYDAVLYFLFGTNPLGYQLVNTGVFVCIILILYSILRQLKTPRIIALTVPLVYAFLPNYSTDRFWYASFQANLSLLFFLISFYAGIKALSIKTVRTVLWKVLSILSLLLSALSYEVALPLALVSVVLFWNPMERLKKKENGLQGHGVFIIITFVALIYIFIFKAMTTTRLVKLDYITNGIHLIQSVIKLNVIDLGIKLPYVLGEILSRYANPLMLGLAGLLFITIFLYLYTQVSKPLVDFPKRIVFANFTLLSIIIFFLGYSIFFTNTNIGFSSSGIDNRVVLAAAIGVALAFVGGIGLVSSFLPDKYARWLFCVFISLIATSGFLIINTIANFWGVAYQRDQTVLADIHQHFPVMPKGSTLILDGVCSYDGPGIVFESQWDLLGALQVMYHDPKLRADIVTPRLRIGKTQLTTQIYTTFAYYPYKKLFIYNYNTKQTYQIPNAKAAYAYFVQYNPDLTSKCAGGTVGNGVSIF